MCAWLYREWECYFHCLPLQHCSSSLPVFLSHHPTNPPALPDSVEKGLSLCLFPQNPALNPLACNCLCFKPKLSGTGLNFAYNYSIKINLYAHYSRTLSSFRKQLNIHLIKRLLSCDYQINVVSWLADIWVVMFWINCVICYRYLLWCSFCLMYHIIVIDMYVYIVY